SQVQARKVLGTISKPLKSSAQRKKPKLAPFSIEIPEGWAIQTDSRRYFRLLQLQPDRSFELRKSWIVPKTPAQVEQGLQGGMRFLDLKEAPSRTQTADMTAGKLNIGHLHYKTGILKDGGQVLFGLFVTRNHSYLTISTSKTSSPAELALKILQSVRFT
ncbi:MAG: hypothetical protein HY551_05405, partial [Elusimicrobia bacterium]|nr:hypothetical protein [Elusimicrobiota bacterium]